MGRETGSVGEGKPDLPEHYAFIGLALGLLLAGIYFHAVIAYIPNHLFPVHLLPMVLIVPIFLGVPVIFEKVYWWWSDA